MAHNILIWKKAQVMSLVTAVPYYLHVEDNIKTCKHDGNPDTRQNQQSHYLESNRVILYLGLVTGFLSEMCDLGVAIAPAGNASMEFMWRQILFSLGWSCMVTLIVYIVMMCIQCISNNTNEHFQATFLFGTVAGLALAIAWNQTIKGSWHLVVVIPVSVIAIITFQRKCTEKCENEKGCEEKLTIV